jgi:hypothetical protein
MVLLGNVCRMEACFSLFADSVSLEQDRCTVYAEHTITSEIILGATDGTPT